MSKRFLKLSTVFAMAVALGVILILAGCEGAVTPSEPTPERPPRPPAGPPPPRPGTTPMVALTFDDGPNNVVTNRILDVLEEHGGRATFYVQGYRVIPEAATVIRTLSLGSEVAGHSWDHPDLSTLSEGEVRRQLQQTRNMLRIFFDHDDFEHPPLPHFRPPFGAVNQTVLDVAEDMWYAIVGWTMDTNDWMPVNQNVEFLYNFIMENVEDGSVILLHDIWPTTADAMELVIPSLIERGFELVTVTEMLYHTGYLDPGMVFGTVFGLPPGFEQTPVPRP